MTQSKLFERDRDTGLLIPTYWLAYGAGVNSTALLVLLATGQLPQHLPFRALFADTLTERPETYAYLRRITAWAGLRGIALETCRDKEGVLDRWRRFHVCGNRQWRSCSDHAKLRPMEKYIREHGDQDDAKLIGIHAGESHRATPARKNERRKFYPLVELGVDQDGCRQIIRNAGLCVPFKSGCWCCPFMRKREILDLARDPQRFAQIVALEDEANRIHPGLASCWQWSKPARDYVKDLEALDAQGRELPFEEDDDHLPCECFSA